MFREYNSSRISVPIVPPRLCWVVIENEVERGVVISADVPVLLGDVSEPDVDVLIVGTNDVRHRVNAVCNVFESVLDAHRAID